MKSIELPGVAGFAGFDGSGKDTIANTIRDELTGIPVVGLGDVLGDLIEEQGGDRDDREKKRATSKFLAEQYGDPAIMAKIAFGDYDEITLNGQTYEFGDRYRNADGEIYITSIRRLAEAEEIKRRGGALLWIHVPVEERYQRAILRARGSGDTFATLEEFIAKGEKEIYADDPNDPNSVNVSRVFGAADYIYNNPKRDREELIEHLSTTFQLPRHLS